MENNTKIVPQREKFTAKSFKGIIPTVLAAIVLACGFVLNRYELAPKGIAYMLMLIGAVSLIVMLLKGTKVEQKGSKDDIDTV